MTEFYRWPEAPRLALTFFLALCVLAQTSAALLSLYRRGGRGRRLVENLLELSILAHLLVCAQMHGEVMQNYLAGLIPPTGYSGQRLLVFALLLLLSLMLLLAEKAPHRLLVAAVAAVTLAPMEALAGKAFLYLYLAALLFWLVRSLFRAWGFAREIQMGLSALSIKNAMDSLHTGIMFCEKDGFVIFVNAQMQRLMRVLTGNEQRNGRHFYEQLTLGAIEAGCSVSRVEDQSVCLLPDGSAWQFNVSALRLGKKPYFQLTATGISEQWALITQLQRKNQELFKRQEELGEVLAKLDILIRERETQQVKMRAHDILGERLSLLLRAVRSEQALDYAQLRTLSSGLIDDLKAMEGKPSPQDELDGLLQAFGAVGVDILIEGDLPVDTAKGHLMAEVIREAAANAVRHGFATQVYVQLGEAEGVFCLQITDNGRGCADKLREGGGIGGMRKKAEPFGGSVTVAASPQFKLKVELPIS